MHLHGLRHFLLSIVALSGNAFAGELVIKNVNVVDVDAGVVIAARSIAIGDGHIKEIGAQESVRTPTDARVVDGTGRYLMPALWDMHIHPIDLNSLSLMIANGVGGARIMWGKPDHLEWRARVELGDLLGPRLLIAGPIIEGAPPEHMTSVVDTEGRRLVKTYADGVAEVRRHRAAGFDYIKVYNNIPSDAYNGIVSEAALLHIPVVGHVPFAPGIRGALAAHQKSIEHLRGYIEALVPANAPIQPGVDLRSRTLAWEYADMSKVPELARSTRAAGAWQCPTLVTSIYFAPTKDIERYLSTKEAEFLDAPTREAFRHRERVKWLGNFSEADFVRATRLNDRQFALLRAMHAVGVPILAGTDSNSFGFALHRELEAFVEAGLSPAEALKTATINPARFAALENEVGRVAPGYAADLVLLEADPLKDIRNTARIQAVVLRGRFLDRSALDEMLAKAKAQLH